jgi:hypothetical protein
VGLLSGGVAEATLPPGDEGIVGREREPTPDPLERFNELNDGGCAEVVLYEPSENIVAGDGYWLVHPQAASPEIWRIPGRRTATTRR